LSSDTSYLRFVFFCRSSNPKGIFVVPDILANAEWTKHMNKNTLAEYPRYFFS